MNHIVNFGHLQARFAFDPLTLVHKVHAVRTIQPGEELTFSYIDEKQLYWPRQQHVKAHWGFDCRCKLCSAPEQARAASDDRLQRIAVLRKSLFHFTVENYRKITPDMAIELVSLYEEEGLDGALAEAYMIASLWHCVWGNGRETKEWAALAIENVGDGLVQFNLVSDCKTCLYGFTLNLNRVLTLLSISG